MKQHKLLMTVRIFLFIHMSFSLQTTVFEKYPCNYLSCLINFPSRKKIYPYDNNYDIINSHVSFSIDKTAAVCATGIVAVY